MDSLSIGKRITGTSYSVQREGVEAIPSDVRLPPPRFCENTYLTWNLETLAAYVGSWLSTQELRMSMQAQGRICTLRVLYGIFFFQKSIFQVNISIARPLISPRPPSVFVIREQVLEL